MASYDLTTNTAAGIPFLGINRHFVVATAEIDLNSYASSDVLTVLSIPAGVRVLMVETEVLTAADSATSATLNVGDSDDADGYDAVNLKTAGVHCTAIGTDAYGASGKRYTSNGSILISPAYSGTTTQKGKVKVRAIGVKMT